MAEKLPMHTRESGNQNVFIEALDGLQDHMREILRDTTEYCERGEAAAQLAEKYHQELEEITQPSSYEELSTLVLARVYLDAISSLGRLRQFLYAKKNKHADSLDRKSIYLTARKQFQEAVDSYFEHFDDESEETSHQVLREIVSSARLLVTNRKWADSLMNDHDHVFLGSVLSERMVAISLKEHVHPGARYGTATEDASPTKADVVLPFRQGDVHVQVKMRWMQPTRLKFHPNAQPPRVVVPMHNIRSDLTQAEDKKLASSIKRVAARAVL